MPEPLLPSTGPHVNPVRIVSRQLFGFTLHPGTLAQYVDLARHAASSGRAEGPDAGVTVLYHNLHSLYLWFRSAELRSHYAAHTVLVDGMPLIALLRLAGHPAGRAQRVTYVDLIYPLLEMARDEGIKVFHIGQSAEVQESAMDLIRERIPGIDIVGQHGFFDQTPQSAESLELVQRINDQGTGLLLVGFGTPRQEAWLHAHREQLRVPAVYACGACFEYVAGDVRTPPRWMGRLGLEWAFRLGENPRRFAFRYLVEPVILAGHLFKATVTGHRRSARTVETTPALPGKDPGP